MKEAGAGFKNIEHFFVLMLENRSFDHMFGVDPKWQSKPLSGCEAQPLGPASPSAPPVPIQYNAPDRTYPDPPHEFKDVRYQLTGHRDLDYGTRPLSMDGFAASARDGMLEGGEHTGHLVAARAQGKYALQCQGPGEVPILRQLAASFVVCDRWYSSMPGPTWPNRFFVHAASSGGLDNSPSTSIWAVVKKVAMKDLTFHFQHGTIYSRLRKKNWRIYYGSAFPQILAIKEMLDYFGSELLLKVLGVSKNFRNFDKFEADLLSATDVPRYVFIEPNHAITSEGHSGNSQHPDGSVRNGEALIKTVYEAIRNSPSLWEKSALIITYDEHGGFYDHEIPPKAVPPGDAPLNHCKAQYPANFKFDLFGVRVPTVIVSPWTNAGIIDSVRYDHTSILRTVADKFGFNDSLTDRDRNAKSFSHLFVRDTPRKDAPERLGDVQPANEDEDGGRPENAGGAGEDSLYAGNLTGFLRIALSVDYFLREREASFPRRMGCLLLSQVLPSLAMVSTPRITNRTEARQYIADVAKRFALAVEAEQPVER
jgi:phospholipase C